MNLKKRNTARSRKLLLCVAAILLCISAPLRAQELNCKISINHSKISSSTTVFSTLETALTEFMNSREWTTQKYSKIERINCTFNITVNEYSAADGTFKCELMVQSTRPIFNTNINTVVYGNKDQNFNFTYQENDQLEYREDQMESNLTAMMAYYAYLIIGLDMDTMAPMGGTEVLRKVESIVNSAQNMSEAGWKAYSDSKNRHAIINDYMDPAMEAYRTLQYNYHRKGLDIMATNSERGRNEITESLALLKQAHSSKPMALLPQIFTDYKRDELVNIYSKGNNKEKEDVYTLLSNLNPSQNDFWDAIIKKK
ncbi:MAG: DUF4835 family protein [Bacteroidaceae bacterium]|nr:DUF4835 family protein [Bacteroidaceae bacterium]MCR4701228.1 DUF4835 family protein [Bacteroidaceae bacterium]